MTTHFSSLKHLSLITLSLALFCAGALVAVPLSASAAPVAFPVRLSSDLRYLVDNAGTPMLIHGDSPWSIIVQLDKTEVVDYLADRRNKGFNALVVNLVEIRFADSPPKNAFGQGPFTTPGDFGTPNEAYFAHADWVLQKAAEYGMLVLLNPAYMGHPAAGQGGSSTQGWYDEIAAAGPTKSKDYGRFLGNRYKNYKNIIWVWAGDQIPAAGSSGESNQIEMLKGVKETAPTHLHTAHFKRTTTALEGANYAPFMDLDLNYAGHLTYVNAKRAYTRANRRPTFLFEAQYENTPLTPTSRQVLRAQAYWTNLSGSTGYVFGHHPLWCLTNKPICGNFKAGGQWKAYLDSIGAQDMTRVLAAFQNRPWQTLVPDFGHGVVTAGFGTFDDYDYVTAARSPDGKLVMAYVPSTGTGSRTLTVDMTELGGSASGRWYNPTNGQYTTIAGPPFANTGSRTFTTPGNNGTGTNDWLLVLEVGAPPDTPPPPSSPPRPLEVRHRSASALASRP